MAEGTDTRLMKTRLNIRTRAFFEALRRGLLNSDELEKAATELEAWIERDQRSFSKSKKRMLAK